MQRVASQGFDDSYTGIRIRSDGTLFKIEKAMVWNILELSDIGIGSGSGLDHVERRQVNGNEDWKRYKIIGQAAALLKISDIVK
jgi:NADH:ubiquinone oxidoreductase subunit D